MLDVVGLSADAESIYEALLSREQATATDLAAATGLPDERVRIALRALENHGVVGRASASSEHYVAVDPGIALDVLLLEREEQLKRARMRVHELTERFHQAGAGRDPAKLVEIITGRQTLIQRVDQIQRSARREIRCFDTPPYAGNAIVANNAELDLLDRGGIARVIYDRAAVELSGRLADLEEGVGWGEQARVLPRLPMKLLLIDDRIGVVPLQASPSAIESTILVYPSGLLEGLSALFETLWQLALPLELVSATSARSGAAPDDQPSPGERRILSMLTAGLPDESIARQLGISDRTYQRRIHDLMLRLHVQTRFQLARQAIRRGWLSDDEEEPSTEEDADPRRSAGLVGVAGRVTATNALPRLSGQPVATRYRNGSVVRAAGRRAPVASRAPREPTGG